MANTPLVRSTHFNWNWGLPIVVTHDHHIPEFGSYLTTTQRDYIKCSQVRHWLQCLWQCLENILNNSIIEGDDVTIWVGLAMMEGVHQLLKSEIHVCGPVAMPLWFKLGSSTKRTASISQGFQLNLSCSPWQWWDNVTGGSVFYTKEYSWFKSSGWCWPCGSLCCQNMVFITLCLLYFLRIRFEPNLWAWFRWSRLNLRRTQLN